MYFYILVDSIAFSIIAYLDDSHYEIRTEFKDHVDQLDWSQLVQNTRALSWLEGRQEIYAFIDDLYWNPHPDMKCFLEHHGIELPDLYIMVHLTNYHEEIKLYSRKYLDIGFDLLNYHRVMEFKEYLIYHTPSIHKLIGQCIFHAQAIPLVKELMENQNNPPQAHSYFWKMISKHPESFECGLLIENDSRIHWDMLSWNTHPIAIDTLKKNLSHPDISWRGICSNKSAASILIPILENPRDHRLQWMELSDNSNTEIIQFIRSHRLESFYQAAGCSRNSNPLMKEVLIEFPNLRHPFSLLRNYAYDVFPLLPIKEIMEDDEFRPILFSYASKHPYLFLPRKTTLKEQERRYRELFF